jgi:nicotinamide mononucleotide transporter
LEDFLCNFVAFNGRYFPHFILKNTMVSQYIEWFAAIFSLVCVVLTVYKNPSCWGVGLVGIVAYMFVFFNAKLYADTILQVVFFVQGVYGWYYWLKGSENASEKVPITQLSMREWGLTIFSIVLLTVLTGSLLQRYTDASAPFLDSFIMAASIVGNMLMARKVWDNWAIWVVVNVLSIGLYYYKELYVSSGLYIIFLFLAIKGGLEWRKDLQIHASKINAG